MRLRFSIRDLLWLTALVAVLMAWWLASANLARVQHDLATTKQDLAKTKTKLKNVSAAWEQSQSHFRWLGLEQSSQEPSPSLKFFPPNWLYQPH